jgi:hypothetical protein
MSLTVFYSWQSDLPKETNRNFIEAVLKKVIDQLGRDVELQESLRDEEVVLDKDTKGVPGTPPIVDTIFGKISDCCVFVPDLTFVGRTDANRLIPNPNVLIEYGWALKVLGHAAIVPLMNSAFGEPTPDALPFDMRHLRRPVTYHLQTDDNPEIKSRVKKDLVDQLTDHVRLAIGARLSSRPSDEPFKGTPCTENPSTFLEKEETFASLRRFGDGGQALVLPSVQRLFLRLIPETPLTRIRSGKIALDLVRSGGLIPMGGRPGERGISLDRNRYGAFSYDQNEGKILGMSQLFKSGELWGIDTFTIDGTRPRGLSKEGFTVFLITSVEEVFACTLTNFLKFARETLRLNGSIRFVAGATDIKGYEVAKRDGWRDGRVLDEHITYEGVINDLGDQATTILRPFFEYFWEECGLERPDVEIYR